jgi:RimJ/RimL family protein N-acetyltransferase
MQAPDAALDTLRLRLRIPESSDADPMMEIHQDPEVIKSILLTAPPGGITVAWRNIAMMVGHWHLRGYGQWTVIEKTSGEVIGRVGLWNPEGWPGIELGWIIRRSRWGHGFATEAAEAALQWAWDNVDTDHIISIIPPDSLASVRVAEKIGERFERADTMNGASVRIYGVRRAAGCHHQPQQSE